MLSLLSSRDTTQHSNSSIVSDHGNARNTPEVPGTVLAGVTVLIALLALYIGILQLRNEYQKRYEARQLENDLIELEAEISKVSKIGHQAHMK
jgi:hypothetical protein